MKHFTFRELLHSDLALKNDILNLPPRHEAAKIYFKLETLVDDLLDPIREKFAVPMIITSGYRCERLNKLVGGVDDSQHMRGEAVDFCFAGFSRRDMVIAFFEIAEEFDYDQLIYYKEKGVIHISYIRDDNREEVFIK